MGQKVACQKRFNYIVLKTKKMSSVLCYRDSLARFDASYEQAEAWQRLVSGKNIRESDRVMLLHEQMESRIMKETGCTYEEAHKQTNKVYNWAKAYLEEGGVFK